MRKEGEHVVGVEEESVLLEAGIILHPTSHQIGNKMAAEEGDVLILLGIQELRLFLMIQLHH